jgi:hypothetical protein
LQFIPVDRTNPLEHGQPTAPTEVLTILQRACYDCHSNETEWPWYSKIAPASFLISSDVKNGRKEVNFSVWQRYDAPRKLRKLREIAKEVEKGTMPQPYYLLLHPESKLSARDRELVVKWAKQG